MYPHRSSVKSPSPHPQCTYSLNARNLQAEEFGTLVAKNFSLPAPLGEILYYRGITELSEVQDFLYPQLSMLPSPHTMKGMRQAVACILETIQAQKPIFVHGDYDVDGITATVLLTSFFKEVGIKGKVYSYIPNRLIENYGLSVGSINRLVALSSGQAQGGLLITVDCGIAADKEVDYAKKLGLRVIITDHHEPKEILPDAEAVINPKQKGCEFPFSSLSGVGVAFFLVVALRKALVESDVLAIASLPNLKKYLDLVALGTVADVVPLVGVNRVLVRAGLEVLSARRRIGVFYLCDLCGIQERQLQPEDIAFKLAPRINASGRLGSPEVSFNLLSAEDRSQALKCAQQLELMNTQRKQLESDVLAGVEDRCDQQVQAGATGVVVYQENCHPGVIGILASRMTDCFGLPVIIFTDDNTDGCEEYLKGSGRSVAGVNLLQVLQQCTQWIEQFGGHSMATGLSIKKANLNDFVQKFQGIANSIESLHASRGVVAIDYHFRDKKHLTRKFAQALQMMQPFGEGNPEPKFLLSCEQILRAKDVKGHVAFQVRANGCVLPGIGFRLAEAIPNFNKPVDLIFQLKQSWFKGEGRVQVQAFHFISI